MKKYLLILMISVTVLAGCKGQKKTEKQTIYNKDFNWTISIPAGFDTVSAEKWTKMQKRGADAIEKTYEAEVENNAKTIFVFQSDRFNYFESNYQPFDTAVDGSYLESFNQVNEILYGTFEAQIPQAKLDSFSSKTVISGLEFQTFQVRITFPDKRVLKLQLFSRLFEKREFTVNIMTMDKGKEQELMASWQNSTFGK